MKAKIITVCAPEHLVDLGFKSNVDRVLGLLDHGVKNHEPASIFQHAKHFLYHSFRIVKMMQTKRHKGAIERFRLKGQSVGFTGTLIISRNPIFMLVTNVEHGQRLINTNDPTALKPLRHRPRHSTGPRRHVENPLIALQDEHFSQFLGKISADLRRAPIELCGVLRVMKMSLVPVAMAMVMFVAVSVIMVVTMFVIVGVLMLMLVSVIMNLRLAVAMFVTVFMVVIVLLFVIMRMFVLMFFAHDFIIPSGSFSSAVKIARQARLPTALKSSTLQAIP
jgi:hypothetical protein